MTATMPFGRYRGEPIENVPGDYLRWVLGNCTLLQSGLRAAVLAELKRREVGEGPGLFDETPETPKAPDWRPLVKRWYAQLARKYHPDRDGSTAVMQAINDAHELLKKMLSGQ